jgi:hypothetical protein
MNDTTNHASRTTISGGGEAQSQITDDEWAAAAAQFWAPQSPLIRPEDKAAPLYSDVIAALDGTDIVLRDYSERAHRVPCPHCDKGPRDGALAVKITPDRVLWFCHRCGTKGGRFFGESGRDQVGYTPEVDNRVLDIHGRRQWHWLCQTITADDACGRYLIGRRCALPGEKAKFIDNDTLGPGTHLAFNPCHDGFWEQADPDRWRSRYNPAVMIGLITDTLTGTPLSLHHTTLLNGGGRGQRRYLADHRKKGGVVRLDALVDEELVIGEGIETCLAYKALYPEKSVWCCLDAGNVGDFPIIGGLKRLTVLVDNDDAGLKAYDRVTERYTGITVKPVMSDVPGEDFNDWLRRVSK